MSLGFVSPQNPRPSTGRTLTAPKDDLATTTYRTTYSIRSFRSYVAYVSTYSIFSCASLLSVFTIGGVASFNSLVSVLSINSVASVASINSVASIGCVDSVAQICAPPTYWIVLMCGLAVVYLNIICFSIFERCPNPTTSTAGVLIAAGVI